VLRTIDLIGGEPHNPGSCGSTNSQGFCSSIGANSGSQLPARPSSSPYQEARTRRRCCSRLKNLKHVTNCSSTFASLTSTTDCENRVRKTPNGCGNWLESRTSRNKDSEVLLLGKELASHFRRGSRRQRRVHRRWFHESREGNAVKHKKRGKTWPKRLDDHLRELINRYSPKEGDSIFKPFDARSNGTAAVRTAPHGFAGEEARKPSR